MILSDQDLSYVSLGVIMAFDVAPVVIGVGSGAYRRLFGSPTQTTDGMEVSSAQLIGDSTAALKESTLSKPIDPTRKRLVDVDKSDLRRPGIAWPTVLLALCSVVGWFISVTCGILGVFSPWIAIPVSTICIFVAFTPMHDAVHYSVAPKARWLNELVGRISAVPFSAPMPAFRLVHLLHHRYANDPVRDPDHWAGEGSQWLLPLRWASMFPYYKFYVVHMHINSEKDVRVASLPLLLEILFTLAGFFLVQLALWWHFSYVSVLHTVLPSVFAAMMLAYVFDYVPHRPHLVPYKDDPYLSTSVTMGLWEGMLTPLLLYQNYHNIHHLFPFLPFYHYSLVWFKHRDELKAKGTRILPFFLLPNRRNYLKELQQLEGGERKEEEEKKKR